MPRGAVFRQINSAQNANWNANDASKCEQFQRADDRICHAATDLADRRR